MQPPIFQAKLLTLLSSTLKILTHHNNKYHRKTHKEISDSTSSSEFRYCGKEGTSPQSKKYIYIKNLIDTAFSEYCMFCMLKEA